MAASSAEHQNKKFVLRWLTQNAFNALSIDNKIKIFLKVYDKEVPNKIIGEGFAPMMINIIRSEGNEKLNEIIRKKISESENENEDESENESRIEFIPAQ